MNLPLPKVNYMSNCVLESNTETSSYLKADEGEIYQSAVRALQAEKDSLTLLIGPPGTGKTRAALEAAIEKDWKITIVRPPVPFGASYGLLPGGLGEKIDPWMDGIKDILVDLDISPFSATDPAKGFIEFASFEHLQSRTLYDFVIFDEVQNCNLSEIYVTMTRIGKGSRMAICGDIDQISSRQRNSGLPVLHDMMLVTNSMNVIDFTHAKCYRSGLCGDVTSMFSTHWANNEVKANASV
jgi:phosphate starvation-inducible PhoH-like protein